MFMPLKNRRMIFEYIFTEGVMVAKKDLNAKRHGDVAVPNLHVIKTMQSLKSRGYVKEQFAWRHFYWSLTNEGIQYLRDYLHLPAEIVPNTLKRQTRPDAAPRPRPKPTGAPRGGPPQDRSDYRRGGQPGEDGADKKGDVGAGATTEFQFRGGFGRGRGSQNN